MNLLNPDVTLKDKHWRVIMLFPGSIQELKERIRQRTNLPLGPSIDTHGETFLSQEVVVNLLQETRRAFERCQKVSITYSAYMY